MILSHDENLMNVKDVGSSYYLLMLAVHREPSRNGKQASLCGTYWCPLQE